MPTTRDADGDLRIGGVSLVELARDPRIGTPAYVYDLDAIAKEARDVVAALREDGGEGHLAAYAIKANSAGPIVRAVAREGCGADVVSGAELLVALGCGIAASKIVFSGVAKTDDEIDRAIAAGPDGILAIQVESIEELERVDARARAAARVAKVGIRVNPAVDRASLGTHDHIATGHDEAKFGVPRDDIGTAVAIAGRLRHVELVGIAAHVGSQITSVDSYVDAAKTLFGIAGGVREQGAKLRFVDTGGGFGIDYGDGACPPPADFVRATRAAMKGSRVEDLPLHIEPGRSLVAAHGVLLARVIREKRTPHLRGEVQRAWLVIDAGMNDLIRPALYQARHRVVPLEAETPLDYAHRVVGPVCESSDDFGDHRGLVAGGYIALLDAGAYGYVMASQYNGRPLPAEAFVRGGRVVASVPRASVASWVETRVGIEERG